MNKKITPKQDKEMKKLHKQGLNYKKIANKFGFSPSVVSLHINNRKGISHKADGIGDNPDEIPLFIRENLATREKESNPLAVEKDRIKRNVCKICGKAKEEKWAKTNVCSLKCFVVLTTF